MRVKVLGSFDVGDRSFRAGETAFLVDELAARLAERSLVELLLEPNPPEAPEPVKRTRGSRQA